MSASLVGSEMCIRDRSWGRAQNAPCPRTSGPTAGGHPRRRVGGRGLQPVSYTHLTLPTICSV
eukprot:694234-Alexandrium_andersonii.AAC.1